MRTRKDIEKDADDYADTKETIVLEVLLDIRELLLKRKVKT